MKIITLMCVFIASATGMSEATAPMRTYYRTYWHDYKADAAMMLGMAIGMIL